MPPLAYPSLDQAIASVTEVVRIVRNGSMAAERATFAYHGWIVEGLLLDKLLGSPSDPLPIGFAHDVVMSDASFAARSNWLAFPRPVLRRLFHPNSSKRCWLTW